MIFGNYAYFCATKAKEWRMNYEELLAAKNDGKLNLTQLPIGEYYRKQVDGKYRGLVDIRMDLHQNIVFSKALQKECEENGTLANNHRLHFEPIKAEQEISQLILESGTFMSFEQLLSESPAVVAEKDFIDNTLKTLVETTTYLHEKDIRQICFSPRTVFVRKGDHAVMLLSHGSYYLGLTDQEAFYGSDASYVAPEVLKHGTIDDRCDVYSLGKFMESLFEKASMPMEYKLAIKKACGESPEDRFNTPVDMLKSVEKRRGTFKSVVTFVIASVIALACIGIYFETFPESNPIEYVKPAPRQATDDLLDDGFSPEELGVVSSDSVDYESSDADSVEVAQPTPDYQAKAEQIFRKNFEKEADRILSKIYSKTYMSNSEKQFIADNQETIRELMELQQKMGEEASLTAERAQLIASEIIERISNEKKKQLGGTNSRGVQLPEKK